MSFILSLCIIMAGSIGTPQSQAGSEPAHGTAPAGDTKLVTPLNSDGSSGAVPDSSIGTPAEALNGRATWYDAPSRTDAAAGPILRAWLGKHWRGTWVEVTSGGRSVTVQLTDWCLCKHHRRLIDLDDRAFASLAPLGRGVIRVTVQRVDVTPPATDTEGD